MNLKQSHDAYTRQSQQAYTGGPSAPLPNIPDPDLCATRSSASTLSMRLLGVDEVLRELNSGLAVLLPYEQVQPEVSYTDGIIPDIDRELVRAHWHISAIEGELRKLVRICGMSHLTERIGTPISSMEAQKNGR